MEHPVCNFTLVMPSPLYLKMFLATKVPSLTAGASQYTLYSRVNGGAIARIKFFSHFGTAAGMSEALENWSGRQKCTLTIPINGALD